jgi:hypothetical protein
MRSEIVGSSGEKSTVNEAVGGFSIFLASRISYSIYASQVSNYVLRPVHYFVHIPPPLKARTSKILKIKYGY